MSLSFRMLAPRSSRTRASAPLYVVIVSLLVYIAHLHWTASVESSSSEIPRESTVTTLNTDKKGWSLEKPGKPPLTLLQIAPQSRSDLRIVLATMSTEETSYDHMSISNKVSYAAKHNYTFRIDLSAPEHFHPLAMWHKLNMLESLIRAGGYDWIWWIDFDTLITNTSVALEDIIVDSLEGRNGKDDVDMLLTADCCELNAGSMLFRGTPRLLQFISHVWECGTGPNTPSEQDCILQVIRENPLWKTRALWIPQTKMNSFPAEVPCYDKEQRGWRKGDFVIHFAGAWAYFKGKDPYGLLMRRYERWIDRA